jgi:3-hydroxyisobutyrate dehydrogenase-like beta-hydroxyacid dehydrogenase
MGELIGLARRSGHDATRAVEIVTATPVTSPVVKLASAAMLGSAFPPAFPIDLVAKDFGLVATSAVALGAKIPLSEAVHAIYAGAVEEGYGADNITGIVQRYLA